MRLIKYTIKICIKPKAYDNFLTTNGKVIVSIVSQNIILFCIDEGFLWYLQNFFNIQTILHFGCNHN